MATISGSFTEKAVSATLFVPEAGERVAIAISGTYAQTHQLERAQGDGSWEIVAGPWSTANATVAATYITVRPRERLRLRCKADTSGTGVYSISDGDKALEPLLDSDGNVLAVVTQDTLAFDRTTTFEDALRTEAGLGAVGAATITAVEEGDGVFHRTILTLTAFPVSVVSVTTGNGVGGAVAYTFPAGHITVLGCVGNLSITATTQSDFTDATPEGDIGIGSVVPANADALGTDATDDNMATATAFTMTAYVDNSVVLPPDAAAVKFDGTANAVVANVNVLVDAADIDNDATTVMHVSGTIAIHWINAGDY